MSKGGKLENLAVTRMLKNKSICDLSGRNVAVRLFSKGKNFVVTLGDQILFEGSSAQAAMAFYETTVNLTPKGKRLPKIKKKLIIFSGGLPTLGKR
jgi:hypothetical protein